MNKIKELPTKLKAWWWRLVKGIHRRLGIITRQEHNDMKAELKKRNADISRICAKLEIENTNLRNQKERLKQEPHELAFDFENLLKLYNITKINALVYRIINNTRNNPATVGYLQRWRDRIDDALVTLPTEGDESIDGNIR